MVVSIRNTRIRLRNDEICCCHAKNGTFFSDIYHLSSSASHVQQESRSTTIGVIYIHLAIFCVKICFLSRENELQVLREYVPRSIVFPVGSVATISALEVTRS